VYGRTVSAYSSSLNWAETYSPTVINAAGIKSLLYTNPNREETTDPMYNTNEKTFAHDCNGHRITQPNSSTPIYLMNPNSSAMVSLYASYVSSMLSSKGNYTAILDDEPDDWYALSAMPCNYVSTTWSNAYANEMKSLPRPAIYNGLGIQGRNNSISTTINFNSVAMGGMMEACYTAPWSPPLSSGAYWQTNENIEIKMAAQRKFLICLSNNHTTASTTTGIAYRKYAYASFLLTYDVNNSSLWEGFVTASGYKVEPESKLVALNPVIATPSTIAGLKTASGVYARQYKACYIGGKLVGACAAVVNSDPTYAHAFPYTTYHHTLLLTGGGILDGGTVSAAGPAPPTSMARMTGLIAFP
jgi:hypothetical protein